METLIHGNCLDVKGLYLNTDRDGDKDISGVGVGVFWWQSVAGGITIDVMPGDVGVCMWKYALSHCNELWHVTMLREIALWWTATGSSIRAMIVYIACLQRMIREGSLSNLHEARSHFASPDGTASDGWYLQVYWRYLRTYGRYLRALCPGGVYVIIQIT